MSRFRVTGVTDASVPFADLAAGEYRMYFSSNNTSFAVKDSAGTVTYLAGLTAESVEDLFGNVVLQDTSTIDFIYDDGLGQISAIVKDGSITVAKLSFDPATQTELDAVAAAKEDAANKATDFSVINNTKFPTVQAVNNAIAAAVAGLYDDRGNFSAAGGAYPSSGGSGTAGAILKGDVWTISVGGTLPTGQVVEPGDLVRALQDTPGNTQANWAITQNNIGYVPENVTNKSTDATMAANSATLYPSQSAARGYTDTVAASKVSDTAYAGSWDGVTGVAPSKNAVYDQMETKAPLASPVFTGNPTAPTPSPGDNDTSVATTAFATAADAVVDAAALHKAGTETATGRKTFDLGIALTDIATASPVAGHLYSDTTERVLKWVPPWDTTLAASMPFESWIAVRNQTGSGLANATVVYKTGGASGQILVGPAQANADATSRVLGVTTQAIANNTNGVITRFGIIHNVDTQTPGWAAGDTLYLSAVTPGAITNAAPTGTNRQVRIGIVRVVSTTVGEIQVELDSTVPDASATVRGAMSSADFSTIANDRLAFANILDYGADRTGVTQITTALNNAIASFGGNGGVVVFPPGTYLENTQPYILAANNVTLWAPGGSNCTVLKTSNTTGDQLRMTGYGCKVIGFSIQGPGTGTTSNKTAGTGVDIQSTEGVVSDCSFAYHFDALKINGTLVDVDNLWIRYFKQNGIVVDQNSDHRITRVSMVNNAATLPTGAGIDVRQTASLVLEQLNIIASNIALNLSPANGVTVPSVKGTDCFFDTSAVGLQCIGAGSVLRCEFTNCWFSSMSSKGIALTPAVGGQVDGITFINCDIYNNVGGTTVGVDTNAQTKKWKMTGCSIAGWTTGVNLVAGAAHFPTILGNTIGAVSAFGVNTTGVAIGAGAYGGLVLATNDVVDNTTAATFGAVTITGGTAAAYQKYRIIDNPGINPKGSVGAIAVPATTVTRINDTGYRVSVILKANGTAAPTVITVNGVSTVLPTVNTLHCFTLDPGGTVVMTYANAPTWTWVAN